MQIKNVRVDAVQTEGFKVEARARGLVFYVDQPQASGGTDAGPTPLEYLLTSMAGCVVTIGTIIARQKRLPVRRIEVTIDGDLDTDVFMGKTTEGRPGFTGIRVHTKVDGDLSQEEKEQFLREIESRCPISDNIINLTPMELTIE